MKRIRRAWETPTDLKQELFNNSSKNGKRKLHIYLKAYKQECMKLRQQLLIQAIQYNQDIIWHGLNRMISNGLNLMMTQYISNLHKK